MNVQHNEYIKVDNEKIQTPVVTLVNSQGSMVNLVGTIHIASPNFYDEVFSILNGNDAILYEQVKNEEKQTIKDKLIFLNSIPTLELYKNLSTSINKSSDMKLSKLFNEFITNNPKRKHEYEEYKQKLLDQTRVIPQSEGIDYNHLPQSRERTDISSKDITMNTNIFSGQNLKYLGMKMFTSIMKLFIDEIGKNFYSTLNFEGESPLKYLNGLREQKVLDKIDEYSNIKPNIGVCYGARHLKNLEKMLIEKGYERKNIMYLDAIKKVPLAM